MYINTVGSAGGVVMRTAYIGRTSVLRGLLWLTVFMFVSIHAADYYVDPENGDFRFKPNSPALKVGILPIDRSKIGLRD